MLTGRRFEWFFCEYKGYDQKVEKEVFNENREKLTKKSWKLGKIMKN
jgi:hypothetical protein